MDLLYGGPVADRIYSEVHRIGERSAPPHLSIFMVGDDPASMIYARSKQRKGVSLGAKVSIRRFDPTSPQEEVIDAIKEDASDESVNGIVIERPIPDTWDRHALTDAIPDLKDLESQCPRNLGLMFQGRPMFLPPTPLGSILLMHHYGVTPSGRNIVIMGRSPTVGYPLALLLSRKVPWANATVSMVHASTMDPSCLLSNADIVITAIGRSGYLKGHMLREGSVVIDLGINSDRDGNVVGDADIRSMEGIVSRVTPTPGGTGAVTVACMFLNLFRSVALQSGLVPVHEDDIIRMIYPRSQ